METTNKNLHRIVATAIIRKNGNYLLLQRSPNEEAFPGKWTVPGGKLEVEDYINLPKTTSEHWYFAIENSLRREVKEETNLEVDKLSYLCDIIYISKDKIPIVILSFWGNYKSGQVKLDEENVNYVWASFEEAKKYDLVEGLLDEIKEVEKAISKG